MPDEFLIWSIEHAAWWRPGWMGYTHVLREARRYTRREADEILLRANLVTVNECLIPAAAVAPPESVGWGDTREKAD